MKQKLKIISSIVIAGIFLLIAFGSGGEETKKIKIDINDTKAIETYLQGKWAWEKHTGSPNETWRYRFEIQGNKLKIWDCISNVNDPFDMNVETHTHDFTLGEPTRDVDGYKCRYLLFDESNVSLTYRVLSPIWFISDERLNEPALNSSSGIPSWSKGW